MVESWRGLHPAVACVTVQQTIQSSKKKKNSKSVSAYLKVQ